MHDPRRLLALAVALLSILAVGPARAITFTQHTVTTGFTGGRDVCLADVNGNGRLDVVAGGGYEVSWWENVAKNDFVEHTISDQVSIARSVRAADLNGDGRTDVVAAVWQQNTILFWRSVDGGSFEEVPIEGALVGPHTVDLKDVDGDGDLDILCSGFDLSAAHSEIAWWENVGADSFPKHLISGRFQQSPFIFGERIDDDQHLDVLACGEVNDEVLWWRNDGDAGFAGNEQMIDSTFDAAHTVLARDLDDDGDMDVLGAACMSSQITWWENDGEEQFQRHYLGYLAGALWIDAVDLDDDGDKDLIAAGMGDSNISWWENDGYQHFTKHLLPGGLAEAYCVACGYMDNDWDYDLVAIGKSSNTIAWYENDLLTPAEDSRRSAPDLLSIEAFPNPTRDEADIRFCVPRCSEVSLALFDSSGRKIMTLLSSNMPAGGHALRWDGRGRSGNRLVTGAYVCRLEADGSTATRRVVVVR
jgi:hypothetical protein